jgi:shikimate dehydrogenase
MMCKRKKLAVIGNPVNHSLSPQMHNAALKYLDLDLRYSPVSVKKEELKLFVENAKEKYLGFNITVPHKNDIIQYLDEISVGAQLGNSVNTVKIDGNGKTFGYSTDGYGLEMALYELFWVKPKNEHFLFIGCGGAAQATSAHLLERGANSVSFINRNLQKAQRFADKLKKYFNDVDLKVFSFEDEEGIELLLAKKPIVIQSTSIGLKEGDPLILAETYFKKDLCYYDMIYKETPFLRCAKEKGCKTGNGKLMLLYQGAKSFSIWTGQDAPVKIMKNALETAMDKA